MIYPGSGAGRGSWLFTQPRKLRHYWAPSVSSRIIPGAGVAGLEFAVGSAWSEVRDFGFAWRNSFSKGRAVFDDSMETSSQLDVGAGGSKVLLLLWDPVTPRVFPWHWGSSVDAQGPALHPGQRNIGMLFLAPPWHFLEVTATFES